MKKNRGLVYDSNKGFARFLKYEFKDYFEFDVYKNFKKFNDCTHGYCIIVFAVYSDEDLIDLLRIYKRGIPVIVTAFNEELKAKLKNIEDLLIFDPNKIKSEMRIELKHFLNLAL